MSRKIEQPWRAASVRAVASTSVEPVEPVEPEPRLAEEGRRPAVPDLVAVTTGLVLVLVAAFEGWARLDRGENIFVFFPPLLAWWTPHVGPGTVLAPVVAVAVVAYGPVLATRMRWSRLLLTAWAAASAWIVSLALIDGWQNGIVVRLENGQEYLHDLPRVTGLGQMLSLFSDHILTQGQDPDQTWFWTTHVAAHPPGAFGIFVVLDRIGLSGGGPAGLFVILVGASAAVATAVTLRALGAENLARRALPFAVLFPGAVWIGVSADGMFAGVVAWGVALVALAATRYGVRGIACAVGGGVLLVFALYLSYGLVLAGLFPLVVLAATRRWRVLLPAVAGGAGVVAAFTLSGFWWPDGFAKVQVIYEASIAQDRPYEYFVYANLAAVLFALGPAVLAGLRRLATHPREVPVAVTLLVAAAVVAILLADASGMSKAEVERIWLPFGVWLVLACGMLPRRQVRGWLVAQAVLAIAVNSLLVMPW
jgi:methylthioxylose transferase